MPRRPCRRRWQPWARHRPKSSSSMAAARMAPPRLVVRASWPPRAAAARSSPPASPPPRTHGCCCCTPTPHWSQAGRRRWLWQCATLPAPAIFASPSTTTARRRAGWNTPSPGAAAPSGLPYGDQGLLIHRDLLASVGGLRPLPLMEDVDLVRRLGRHRLEALPVAAVTSAARWRRDGYLRRSARNLACLALWFAGVPPRIIARIYSGTGRR
jgi:hypothetical protein